MIFVPIIGSLCWSSQFHSNRGTAMYHPPVIPCVHNPQEPSPSLHLARQSKKAIFYNISSLRLSENLLPWSSSHQHDMLLRLKAWKPEGTRLTFISLMVEDMSWFWLKVPLRFLKILTEAEYTGGVEWLPHTTKLPINGAARPNVQTCGNESCQRWTQCGGRPRLERSFIRSSGRLIW